MGLCKSVLLDWTGDAVGLLSNQQDSSTTTAPTSTLTEPSLTSLIGITIGDGIQGDEKWCDFVDGKNGFFYGIPYNARRVVKFNLLDKSWTEIGPDFGDGFAKWECGVRSNNGRIYCAPYFANHMLKINTNDDTLMTQWKHLTMLKFQRPVLVLVTCGHQGHLPKTTIYIICHPMPAGS